VLIDNRKDAISAELQQFCYNSPVTLIRGLTAALKMDLSLFSTKSLIETAPDHQVEIRSQYRMPPETNVNHLGEPTWQFESNRSFSTVAKYAQYQAQSFQHSLKVCGHFSIEITIVLLCRKNRKSFVPVLKMVTMNRLANDVALAPPPLPTDSI
jgi:hypothetical protein